MKVLPADPPIDFTDHAYQAQLPEHARSTAVQAIRTNLKATELIVYNNITTKRLLVLERSIFAAVFSLFSLDLWVELGVI